MPVICANEEEFYFPPVEESDAEGLVLIGGKVTPARILEGYKKGIFPWYNHDELPLWWSPDPRFVLFPTELHISKSMRKVLASANFTFKTDTAFEAVITACAGIERATQSGTWITKEIKEAYTFLHYAGYAHSAEAWQEGELVGGMYGIRMGGVFFGESMFSKKTNASKFAFVKFVQQLQSDGVALLDCQVYTTHVESLGARCIARSHFISLLQQLIK